MFDEVVVLPDLSDVQDEAIRYFCFDDNPQFKARCGDETIAEFESDVSAPQNFVLSAALWMLVKFKVHGWTGAQGQDRLKTTARIGWSIPNHDVGSDYAPLGVEGGIARAVKHMQELADFLVERHIALTVAVYPWPLSLVQADPGGRWVAMWREFCVRNCKAFIDTFPDFIAARNAHADWYARY